MNIDHLDIPIQQSDPGEVPMYARVEIVERNGYLEITVFQQPTGERSHKHSERAAGQAKIYPNGRIEASTAPYVNMHYDD